MTCETNLQHTAAKQPLWLLTFLANLLSTVSRAEDKSFYLPALSPPAFRDISPFRQLWCFPGIKSGTNLLPGNPRWWGSWPSTTFSLFPVYKLWVSGKFLGTWCQGDCGKALWGWKCNYLTICLEIFPLLCGTVSASYLRSEILLVQTSVQCIWFCFFVGGTEASLLLCHHFGTRCHIYFNQTKKVSTNCNLQCFINWKHIIWVSILW